MEGNDSDFAAGVGGGGRKTTGGSAVLRLRQEAGTEAGLLI